ncbi:cytochrome-c peroxidase [Caenispirillum bisanense]|uniref:cytochrome-c peroxidase n=1 Tax=Caenispirillum bisanense TaxID=414052 RepID=UPI001596E31D|nr:cytochrome c peroxidase [Caenispirillum bisanense]
MQPGDVPRVVVAGEPVEPVPVAVPVDPALADLGRHLFFDTRLSGDGTLSCASCHDLATGGDDGRPRAVGPGGVLRPYNAPSLFNLAFHDRYGWAAEYRSLPQQVGHAVEEEMGATWPQVTARLAADPAVTQRAPQGLDRPLAEAALAAYVASLVTPDSRFDRWLGGDATALTEEERRGYALFKSYGCASCHQGKAMGGTMVQKVGLFHPFFPRRGDSPEADLGRFAVTGQEQDRHVFKVPSLRNVAETAPYLHDGSVATLEGAVRLMAYYQVGRSPEDLDVAAISAFLRTLTGTPPGTIRPPVRKVGS